MSNDHQSESRRIDIFHLNPFSVCMDLTDENKHSGSGGHPSAINAPLTRKTSKSLPVKATYNFSFRQHESCFTDISNSKSPSKNDSPMFYIGGQSPPTQPSLISDAEHVHPSSISGKEIDRIDKSIRRTCSADALSTFKKHNLSSRESRNGKVWSEVLTMMVVSMYT